MKKFVYRLIIYVLILGVIAAVTFAPNAGSSEPSLAYWIIGGVLLGAWLIFIVVNEIIIHRKKAKQKDVAN